MNQVSTRAHDGAQLLVRRLERDIRWAQDRRRRHEREIEDARRLLAAKPITLAGRTPQLTAISILVIAGGCWAARSAGVPAGWMTIILWLASALTLAVFVGALVSLLKVRARRAAARKVLHSHAARLAHTQYHITEGVHSYIDARVEVRNTRHLHLV